MFERTNMTMWNQMQASHWIGLTLLIVGAFSPFYYAVKNKTNLALATTISLLVTFLIQRVFGLVYVFTSGEISLDPHNLLVTIPKIAWNPVELHRMLTATWLHADYFHVLSNVIIIALVGIPLELRLGGWRFMLLYLIGGLGGSFCWVIFNSGDPTPALGASGAAFGLLGTYLACWPKDEIEFPFFLIRKWPISMIALIYFALEIVRAYSVYGMGQSSNIGYIAHLGGFLFCYVLSRRIAKNGPMPLDIVDSGPSQAGINSSVLDKKRKSMKSLDYNPWSKSEKELDSKAQIVFEKLITASDEIETREAWMEKFITLVVCPECESNLELQNLSGGPAIVCPQKACNFSWP